MPITEFVFPSLKPNTAKGVFDPVLSHFRGVEGLLLLKIGKIIRVDGVDAPAENSSVLTIGKFLVKFSQLNGCHVYRVFTD